MDYKDSGWRIFAGNETDEYIDNSENINLVSLGAVLIRDDSFIDVLDAPIGSVFERNENGDLKLIKEANNGQKIIASLGDSNAF